ncbi:MAG: helix-turn-helix domain-containing protein [Clostridiaceae bacterium]
MERISIGKMAKLNNVSEQTLRLYDRKGLLKPCYIDKNTGYRYYNIKQCARLDMIQYMKSLGMPLKNIKAQLDYKEIGTVKKMLNSQKKLIDEKIIELQLMKRAITKSVENFDRYEVAPKEGVVVLEYIPERRIYCYDGGINIYDYGLETYEYILRHLKEHILLNKLPMMYFSNVGSILRKDILDQEKLISTEVCLFIDEDFQIEDNVEIISSNTFACIYCNSFWEEKKYAEQLLNHIKEKGYKIIGDYICEVVADLPVFLENERNMFIKLQVPIELK